MNTNRSIILIVVLLIGLFLTSCSQTVEMSFYKNGKWLLKSENSYTNNLTNLAGEILEMTGIDIGGGSGLTSLTETVITGFYNVSKNLFREFGVEMDWSQKQSGNETVLLLDLEADSLSRFNALFSSFGNVSCSSSDGSCHLVLEFEGMNQEVFELFGLNEIAPYMDMIQLLNDYELRVRTGKIIDSNADAIHGKTAIWYNPQFVDITFKPVGSGNILLILLILLSIGGLIGVVFLLLKRRHRSKTGEEFIGDYSSSADLDDFFSS